MSFEYLVHAKSYGVLNTRQELLYNPQLRTSWLSSDFSSTRLAGRIQACRSSHLMSLHTTNLVQLKSNCSPPSHSTNLLRMLIPQVFQSRHCRHRHCHHMRQCHRNQNPQCHATSLSHLCLCHQDHPNSHHQRDHHA